MVAEWSRAAAISSREQEDVGSSPSSIKILFSDENFLNNSRVHCSDVYQHRPGHLLGWNSTQYEM